MKAEMHNYERSTHDLGKIWRSTMASGTLVPFMSEVALPGDTWDIDLGCEILTHPTIGPLFGSYKVQLDVFEIPIRLYNGKLHMNMLGIGMDMSAIKLPQVKIKSNFLVDTKELNGQQINTSSIFNYLGIVGLGMQEELSELTYVNRWFNAIPWLGYWDIYKNYYANKQEGIGVVIHKDLSQEVNTLENVIVRSGASSIELPRDYDEDGVIIPMAPDMYAEANFDFVNSDTDPSRLETIATINGVKRRIHLLKKDGQAGLFKL